VFLQAKSFDSAIVYYNKYLDKNPLAIQPIFERGYAFFAAKNYEKALIDFTKVRDLNPENGEVYFWLGETEYAMGHNNLACDAYETAKNKGYTPAIEKIKKYCKKNISLGN
jgi:tetratricopeptide (TPR) repeat protein